MWNEDQGFSSYHKTIFRVQTWQQPFLSDV